jgi:RNA polymerase sigma factor (sigma-70 family)
VTDLATVHDEVRPLMFAIAYRMLGSVAEAEDVVQDAFVRMHAQELEGVVPENAEAFATTIVTRLAIDALRSARRRREVYVGTWLPEPVLDDSVDPAEQVVGVESLSVAFLTLLERLSPVERAVFLLREVFGYEYADVATVVDKSEANCRQIFSRAMRRLEESEPRFAALEGEHFEELERLLADDVVFYADGGGKAPAIKAPLEGAVAVARFVLGLMRQARRFDGGFGAVAVGGEPAYLLLGPDGAVYGLLALETSPEGRVLAMRNQINPDKLGHLGTVGDAYALLASADEHS